MRQKAEDELKKMAPVIAEDSVLQVRRFGISPSRIEELSNFVKVAGMDQGVLWCELYQEKDKCILVEIYTNESAMKAH